MGITTQYRQEIHPLGRHKEIVKALRDGDDGDDGKLVAAIEADIRDGSGQNNFEISKEPGTQN
jgi:hypothetical protein